MCRASNQYDPNDINKPLHKCDIYRQPVAGNILKWVRHSFRRRAWAWLLLFIIRMIVETSEILITNCYIYVYGISCIVGRQIMEKGASQPWQEILQEVTGEGRLDGTALREFFRPLEEWLRQENLRNNEFVGWNYDGDYCKHRSVQIAGFYCFSFFCK